MPSMHSFAVPVEMPFDWESLLAFLRLRATPGIETVTGSSYTRTFNNAGPQTFSVTHDPATAKLQIVYSGDISARGIVQDGTRQIFKTNVDTGPIEAFLGREPWIASFVRENPGLRVPGGWSAFEV